MIILKWLTVAIALMGAARTDVSITLDGTQLDVTKSHEDGIWLLQVEGSGMYSFSYTFGNEELTYSLNDVKTYEDDFILEGYTLNQTTRDYHPFLIVIHKDGTLQLEEVFVDALQQDIVGAYPLNDGYLVHLRTMEENGQGDFQFDHDILRILGSQPAHFTYDEKITRIESIDTGYQVYFDFAEVPEVYVRNTQTVYQGNRVDGLKNNATLTDQVTLHFAGTGTLNDEPITGPYTVFLPGKYHFILQDTSIFFTLNPAITGIESGAIKESTVRIDYAYGQGLLNGDYYAPGEPIEAPGDYIFGIYEDNYAYEIPFQVTARISGVEHLKTYSEPVTIAYHGEGYLNNAFFESGQTIEESGTYVFKVFGANGYLETVQFKIETTPQRAVSDWIEMGLLSSSIGFLSWFVIREVSRFRKRKKTL